MEIGEKKTIKVPPEEAYGRKREGLIADIARSKFPENIIPIVGKKIRVKHIDGNLLDVVIIQVKEDTVTVDGNHPLAGETLVFDVEVTEIV
jgi:FKBP-type peptidyl-prolyl cis-trans isomerase SlpA